jgi:hypothetical protein
MNAKVAIILKKQNISSLILQRDYIIGKKNEL